LASRAAAFPGRLFHVLPSIGDLARSPDDERKAMRFAPVTPKATMFSSVPSAKSVV
jgi:hypothetical protein